MRQYDEAWTVRSDADFCHHYIVGRNGRFLIDRVELTHRYESNREVVYIEAGTQRTPKIHGGIRCSAWVMDHLARRWLIERGLLLDEATTASTGLSLAQELINALTAKCIRLESDVAWTTRQNEQLCDILEKKEQDATVL